MQDIYEKLIHTFFSTPQFEFLFSVPVHNILVSVSTLNLKIWNTCYRSVALKFIFLSLEYNNSFKQLFLVFLIRLLANQKDTNHVKNSCNVYEIPLPLCALNDCCQVYESNLPDYIPCGNQKLTKDLIDRRKSCLIQVRMAVHSFIRCSTVYIP